MVRKRRERDAKPARMIAYDFETTRIEPGTPRPLYLTAHGADFSFSGAVRDMRHLTRILRARFLTPELQGVKFVAWFGNGFDAYFIAAALVTEPDLILRPYLTQGNALRGLRVLHAKDANNPRAKGWEFLDGQAMLGLAGVTLAKFLATFAPDYAKLVGTIDFEREEFDPRNPRHVAYAYRDSEGLYHAMERAQAILLEHFGEPLAVTMGGACIKVFKANVPPDVTVATPRDEVLELIREWVMRGGFCYCVRRYHGPIWKYDINQAYAAAMRDAALPQGFTCHYKGTPPSEVRCYIAQVTASHPSNIIPFYYRTETGGRMASAFSPDRIALTWVTSIEVDQLRAEGWELTIHQAWGWDGHFSMLEYVDRLERLRMTCEGGPSGPIGTMVKAVGNHSYGKTVEQLAPVEYVIGAECPEGWAPFYGDDIEPLEHVFYRFIAPEDVRPKDYHQPQLGAFITAHVRMVLRRAALLDPEAWLYADTDCVVFSRDVTDRLDIHPSRYGAWKVEEAGTVYRIIAKKVYAQDGGDKPKRSAKGMRVRELSAQDFAEWFDGTPPVQLQTQRNNFLAVLRGVDMYRAQERAGTAVEAQTQAPKNRVSSTVTKRR